MTFENASILWGHVVVDELARAGVKHVVVTPGSRSTPLVTAAARHPQIVDHSAIDERSAAFVALGIGMATGVPAALVCTSGTALSNYAPAIAEADLARVPLIVLSADRPPNLVDAGASQAMKQRAIFGEKVRWFADLGLPAADPELLAHARSRAARAAHVAVAEAGPVHLNLPFRKPLEATAVAPEHRDAVPESVAASEAARGRSGARPFATYSDVVNAAAPSEELVALIERAEKPLILAGAPLEVGLTADAAYPRLVGSLAQQLGAPIVAETMSGLRRLAVPNRLDGDLVMADEAFTRVHDVDLVIQLGRWPVNWPQQKWLRGSDADLVTIGPAPADPEHRATAHLRGATLATLRALLQMLSARAAAPAHARAWLAHANRLRQAFEAELVSTPDVDGQVARQVTGEAAPLFVSSSMPLRDIETFVGPADSGPRLYANRGLNGIDGVVSTAAGVAIGLGERVRVLIGDVAFVHDLGGLVSAKRLGAELAIDVIDNGGGRIFDHLPIAEQDDALLARHFTTSPDLDLAAIASAFGFDVRSCDVDDYEPRTGGVTIVRVPPDGQARRRELVERAIERAGKKTPVPGGAVPLVLLHGFTGDKTTWDALRAHLDRPAISLDLLGHGGRPAMSLAESSFEAFVDDVLARLDAEGIERFDLLGYSMGGRVAMGVAAKYPGRVRGLVTIGAHPGIEDAHARTRRRDEDWARADQLEQQGLDRFLEAWLALPIFASLSRLGDDWREASIDQRRRGSAHGYAMALRGAGTGAQPPLWAALDDACIPHLALAGELDQKYVAIAGEMAERITSVTSGVVPDAGHAAHYEAPDAVAAEIEGFIARHITPEREAS